MDTTYLVKFLVEEVSERVNVGLVTVVGDRRRQFWNFIVPTDISNDERGSAFREVNRESPKSM